MAIIAIVLSLFAIAVSLVTMITVMFFLIRRETGETPAPFLSKPTEETPNNVSTGGDTTELENFSPNFTKPVSVKFL